MEKKYNFTYQTKNLVNNKLYIGVHSTNKLDDGYIGCGIHRQSSANKPQTSPFRRAVKKYGYENFTLEILDFFNTKEEAYKEEEFIVDQKWINRRDTYNAQLGGNINGCTSERALKRGDHPFANKVRNIITGEIFDCATDVAELLGVNRNNLYRKLKRQLVNDTEYEYVDKILETDLGRIKGNLVYFNLKQYDLQGNLLATFRDLPEAVETLQINKSSLTNHLRGKRSRYLNCVWTADNIKGNPSNKDINTWFTYVLEKDGKYFKFKSKAEFLPFMGYSKNSLYRVDGKFKKGLRVHGYRFMTKEDYLKEIK